jgi:hypothetical protein
VALGATFVSVAPAEAVTQAETVDEVDYVRRINEIRRAHGLRPVVEDLDLTRKARNWSIDVANGICGLIPICHDPDLAGGIAAPWTKLGENVAYSSLGANGHLMDIFMNSTLHRRNILDPAFTRVGVGVIHRNGLQHVTHKFMAVQGEVIAANAPLSQRYVDVRYDHQFYGDIEWLAVNNVAQGHPERMFKPADGVSRQAMASFLYRLAGSPAGPFPNPRMSDVKSGQPFYKEISWLVQAGIASGYSDGTFRPLAGVTRGAMARYLYVMAGSPQGSFPNPRFRDVPTTHPFYTEIAWLASSGVASGFANGTFQPGTTVSRQAMGAFLHRFADL